MKRRTWIILGLAGLFLLAPAFAAEAKPDKSSPILADQLNMKIKAPITLRAQNSPLAEVLQILAEESGLNFVTGTGVEDAKITIILNNTPLDEAINLVVRAAGLAYEIIGNSILIAIPDKLKEEVGQSGYVVALKYADALEVANILSDLTKNIKVDKGGNRLICYTSPRVIIEIERIVRSIDHPHTQIMLDTRILEVSEDDLKKYGIDWGAAFSFQGGMEHPGENPVKEGYRWSQWTLLPMNRDLGTEINVNIDMLVQDGNAKVLMDSRLTTMNNREAKMHIGDIVPYTIQSYNVSSAGGANMQIEKEEVGVKLAMTPNINEKGEITLALEPEVSSITGWKGANNDLPLVRVRKTNTTVRVADGELIRLAGLVSEDKTVEIKRFPLLGHIPYLGRLFQHRREETKKKNLIIEVRPRIIKQVADTRMEIGTDPVELQQGK